MATCKDCTHYDICTFHITGDENKKCTHFKNTADVAEVKYGEWRSELQKRCDWRGKKQQYYVPNACSECHETVVMRTPFCPHCGAKMDGGKDG